MLLLLVGATLRPCVRRREGRKVVLEVTRPGEKVGVAGAAAAGSPGFCGTSSEVRSASRKKVEGRKGGRRKRPEGCSSVVDPRVDASLSLLTFSSIVTSRLVSISSHLYISILSSPLSARLPLVPLPPCI